MPTLFMAWPIIIVLAIFAGTDWPVLHSWYGYLYLVVYLYSVAGGMSSSKKLSYISFWVVYCCSKMTGIILLSWLRWGYEAQWMSGPFGLYLIVFFMVGYVIGLIYLPPWLNQALSLTGRLIRWFLRVYDFLMRSALYMTCAYYKQSSPFLQRMDRRYRCNGVLMDVENTTEERKNLIEYIAKKRILYHAIFAGIVTFACSLPQGWIMWPLMALDVIVYQRQFFRLSQELAMLYRPRSESYLPKFDYVHIASLVLKVEGNFLAKQSKSVVGWIVQYIVKKIPLLACGPLLYLCGHLAKWFGVSVSRDAVSQGMEGMVLVGCGLVAALITVWIFIPAAIRCKLQLMVHEDGKG